MDKGKSSLGIFKSIGKFFLIFTISWVIVFIMAFPQVYKTSYDIYSESSENLSRIDSERLEGDIKDIYNKVVDIDKKSSKKVKESNKKYNNEKSKIKKIEILANRPFEEEEIKTLQSFTNTIKNKVKSGEDIELIIINKYITSSNILYNIILTSFVVSLIFTIALVIIVSPILVLLSKVSIIEKLDFKNLQKGKSKKNKKKKKK